MLNVPEEELAKASNARIAEMIIRNRDGKVEILPGYDGEYGIPIFSDEDRKTIKKPDARIMQKQTSIGDF